MLLALQSNDRDLAQQHSQQFEQRIAQTAAQLPPIERAAFTQAVDADREKMLAEYQSDPIGLKSRLDVPMGVDAGHARYRSSGRQGLGEIAVKTAVRATIWEVIWKLFR